jgi:hypothetical protein
VNTFQTALATFLAKVDNNALKVVIVQSPDCRLRSSELMVMRIANGQNIKFLGNTLPDSVNIYGLGFRVTPSVRNPRLCSNCLGFGQSKFVEVSLAACIVLSCIHLVSVPNQKNDLPVLCRNCEGVHPTKSELCPVYIKNNNNIT